MLRKLVLTALAVATAAGVALAGAPQASAAVVNRFQLARTTQCLDGYVGYPGNDVYVTGCNTGNFQRWRWSGTGGETQLVSVATGKCAAQAGLGIDLVACQATARLQRWVVSGSQIKKAGTNYCVGRTGPNQVGLVTCNAGDVYQQWART